MKNSGLFSLTAVIALGVVGLAQAKPEPGNSGVGHGHPPGPPPGGSGFAHGRPGGPEPMGSGFLRPGPAPSGSVREVRSWQADVAEAFRKHRPNKEELRDAITKAQASAKGRREARLLEMRQRYGAAAFANREVLAEFRVHARRMAFLNRAKVVATTELDEPKRSKVIARVDKLTQSEQERHEKRMEAFRAARPGEPGGAPSLAASAAASGAAPPLAQSSATPPKPQGPPLTAPGLGRGPAPKGSAQ
jgi:hypothetical protein